MFKISWKYVRSSERVGVWCEDRATLITMICMLEENSKIEQFKIEEAGLTLTNLYTHLGIGSVSKFVVAFSYRSEDY